VHSWPFLFLFLLASCSPRIVEKTTKTTTREIDSLIIFPEQQTSFISFLPKQGDSIILTDRNTGVELTIKEFISQDTVIPNKPVIPKNHVILSASEESPPKKPVTSSLSRSTKQKKEYEFKIKEPQKTIPIKINEKVVEENKTVTITKTAWYYKASLKLVIFLIVAAILLFILRKLNIL
jgi:hypothetical protein